ncbi:MAG: TonB-dependent receptor plug domain-containing protein, partial [Calditrichaeota bacterium]|nr:TonB-dependent receptor plug domain-containing protein [Calditrichota bacterium]
MSRLQRALFSLVFLSLIGFGSKGFPAPPGEKGDFQNSVKITGQVLDAETGDPLIGANVLVAGTSYGAATDLQGRYEIANLPVGTYTIRVVMMGYTTAQKSGVRIFEDHSVSLDFRLQPKIIRLGSLLVWGTRESSSLWENPAALEIISRKQIEASTAQNLGDFLKSQPGLFVYDTGGKGGGKTVSIRGSHTNQVLVLIDGVKINPAQNNLVDLSGISLDWIDHIEILKSGGSTLFGSDAIGGVINIVTRKSASSKQRATLTLGEGSFGSRELGGSLFPEWGPFRMNISYQRRMSNGNFPYVDSFGRDAIRRNNGFWDQNVFVQIA